VSYVDANGIHTYSQEHGSGDPLLLLHGGLVDGDSFGQQTPAFAGRYRVIVPDRRGHGRTSDVDGPITYDVMADDTIAFMDALGTGPAHLVGWSDGGNVGLLVAIKRPDLVRRLVTIGSNFSADGLTREAAESFKPDAPTSAVPIMREAWKLNAVDPDRFETVLEKMQRCWFDYAIPTADLARIAAPTLVMVGDDDIARFEHTIELYDAIPDAQLAVIPGASHVVPLEKPDLVNRLVLDFLAAEGPTMTMMPLRRGDPAMGQ
jgi:pimeloyl-ACP methyl ester carboxylesterase